MNKLPKLYVGPMSKNVVDSVIEFAQENNIDIGFIPSRRQVEFSGGYVNNWTTKAFSEYVAGRAPIERDHGGPGQGLFDDDGFDSFVEDSKYFNIVHIDPWKKINNIPTGALFTSNTIKQLSSKNPDLLFEIGTEESIRKFSVQELNQMISIIKADLSSDMFKKIKYCVIQSGVGLDLASMKNTGTYSEDRLIKMIQVCTSYGLSTKEHNGDYLTPDQVNQRFANGLSAINIAPEFGQIETMCYYNNMDSNDKQRFYEICLASGRWKKWVDPSFDPDKNKKDLVRICGHYNFSSESFKKIKPDISDHVKNEIKNRLKELLIER
tara:strand:- start:1984 stop:2952 length:969 start_codon:yes stop_codon:yes gene_type:complete